MQRSEGVVGRAVRRGLRLLLVVVLGAYIALALFAAFLSNGVIFQPHPSSYRDTADIEKLTSRDGARISVLYLKNDDAQYTILFSHGNAEDLGDLRPFLQDLWAASFSVLAYDYEGYGTSGGPPSEQHVYANSDAAYEYLTRDMKVPPTRVISMGRSLGAAVAIDLASRRQVGGLVAQSAFTTAFRVLTRVPLLPWDKFRNIDKIMNVKCPVLIIHGRADEVIPFWHGKELFEIASEPKLRYWVERGDHNNLQMFAGSKYFDELRAFADGLARTATK